MLLQNMGAIYVFLANTRNVVDKHSHLHVQNVLEEELPDAYLTHKIKSVHHFTH